MKFLGKKIKIPTLVTGIILIAGVALLGFWTSENWQEIFRSGGTEFAICPDAAADQIQRGISDGADDGLQYCEEKSGARESGTCVKSNSASTVNFGYQKSGKLFYDGCLSYNNITINNADTIDNAYITVTANGAQGSDHDANTQIHLYDADNVAINGTNYCTDYLEYTNANLTGNFGSWVLNSSNSWTDGNPYNSVNFDAAVQEVIDRPGWSSANNIAVILYDTLASDGDYTREFYAIELTGSDYAVLTIDYTVVIPYEFNTLTMFLTIAGAIIIILIARKYVLVPAKARVRKKD
jgi:hypothetical protein